ncbi:tetratricopeptide repeat protein [Candidatus Daviesbacteria bacterium]|nr:tetratricopeptide repeat protein [Candidatus Daviesbacteria bacterium]
MVDDSNSSHLHRQAITAALNCSWDEALNINRRLLKHEPDNTDCLNRLAKAYIELGKYLQAKKIYQDVLKLDPYNTIAQKNLKKLSSFKRNSTAHNGQSKNGFSLNSKTSALSPYLFLEEPGKTKLVNLIKVAEPSRLMMMSAGYEVNLITKNRGISVSDQENQYLGVLPDDTAHHLLKLIKGGNKYQALIKSIKSNGLTILIREIFRSKKFRNQASFLDDSKILTYSSDNISLADDEIETEVEEAVEAEEAIV